MVNPLRPARLHDEDDEFVASVARVRVTLAEKARTSVRTSHDDGGAEAAAPTSLGRGPEQKEEAQPGEGEGGGG